MSTTVEQKEVFSKEACIELSELLERSWQSIRNGQSDLRPIESQIKGIFKKEAKRLVNEARKEGAKDYKHILEMHGKITADERLEELKQS